MDLSYDCLSVCLSERGGRRAGEKRRLELLLITRGGGGTYLPWANRPGVAATPTYLPKMRDPHPTLPPKNPKSCIVQEDMGRQERIFRCFWIRL